MSLRNNDQWDKKAAMALVLGVLLSPAAWAHKLNMFAYVENDKVFVEGYFTDGVKPKDSEVTVLSLSGETLLSGKTNDEGGFTFDIPKAPPFKIVLNAGMGHRTEFVVPATEADTAATSDEATAATAAGPAAAAAVDPAVVEQAVRRAVSEALKPVAMELNALKNKTRTSDIVGGIGLIIGLLGGFAFYKARQAKGEIPKT